MLFRFGLTFYDIERAEEYFEEIWFSYDLLISFRRKRGFAKLREDVKFFDEVIALLSDFVKKGTEFFSNLFEFRFKPSNELAEKLNKGFVKFMDAFKKLFSYIDVIEQIEEYITEYIKDGEKVVLSDPLYSISFLFKEGKQVKFVSPERAIIEFLSKVVREGKKLAAILRKNLKEDIKAGKFSNKTIEILEGIFKRHNRPAIEIDFFKRWLKKQTPESFARTIELIKQ